MKAVHSFKAMAVDNPATQCDNPVALNPQSVFLWDSTNQNSVYPAIEAININHLQKPLSIF